MTTTKCPVCGKEGAVVTRPFEGYMQGWETTLAECSHCHLSYSVRRDVPEHLYEHIYRQANSIPGYARYVGYAAEIQRQKDPGQWLAALEDPYRVALEWLDTHPDVTPVLEIGSGLGYLTHALRRRGVDAIGVDLSESAVTAARTRFNDPDGYLLPNEVAERYPGGFGAVIGLEIVEHVPDPIDFVREAMAYLRPGGTLVMSTPNRDAFTTETLWESDAPPVHLTWFGSHSMTIIAEAVDAELNIIDLSSDDSDGVLPIGGTNECFEPLLTATGDVTTASKNWSSPTRRRVEALLTRLKPSRASRQRLPGVSRQKVVAPPTSTTLGVALTLRG